MVMFLLRRHYILLLSTMLFGISRSFQPHGTIRASFAALPRCTTRGNQPFVCHPSYFSTRLHNNILDASLEQVPNQSVISAVERVGGKGVLPSDIAAAAGISLSQAKQELTRLAAVSQADLAVSADGDLIYKFPSGLSSIVANNSAKYKTLQAFRQVWPTVFWLLRVSFGVTLLASLVAIFSTIFFLQSSSSSDDDRRRDNRGFGGGGGGMGWYFGPSPFDFFYYRPYGAYGYYNSNDDPEDMGFLESVFSYVFGDGDPNSGLEARRLALAADMIRQNKGAVTAEQLAPFADDAPDTAASTYVDEAFVLPIVSAMGGEPVVSEEGEIVYVFSELQTSAMTSGKSKALVAPNKEATILKRVGMSAKASSREIVQVLQYNGISTRGAVERQDLIALLEEALPPMTAAEEAEAVEADPTMLLEREWKFSLASDTNKFLAGGLGVVNVGGAIYLGTLLGRYSAYGVQLPDWFGVVQTFYPLLLGYGVLFNAIPLLRRLWIGRQNQKIQDRNRRRRKWRDALQSANSRLARKLKQAAKLGTRMKRIGTSTEDIIFDTKKTTVADLEATKSKKELEEFDKLLGDTTKSKNEDFEKLSGEAPEEKPFQ